MPPREVDARQELPELEQEVLERWRERDVFGESLRNRDGAEQWVFYEGPPTANGRPGSHHVLSRVFKDIYPRYKTMRGYRVERKGGWDCHGLPVEIAVEQKLGITSKTEIEQYGIKEFNEECRNSVFEYLEEWDRLTERIGFWVDLEHAYRTLDESYIESVWWALKTISDKGLLYEGHKVVPYCYRCGTALSSHEVALGYKDVVDPSVYVRLPVHFPAAGIADTTAQQLGSQVGTQGSEADRKSPLREGDSLLIWTTTPWTLPGNVAVAVGPDIEYVRAKVGEETLIVAEALVGRVLGEDAEILDRFPGRDLIGERNNGVYSGPTYEGPIFNTAEPGGFPIIAGDFVTTEDGTGLVHIAPAFGEDDFNVALASGMFDQTRPGTLFNPVKPDGTYDQRVRSHNGRSYEGRTVKDPTLTEELIADLDARGLLFKRTDYEHSYPHCWRCDTPLIYYAKPSWYIATSKLRERMMAANETINWYPPHIKHGRFGDWLSNNVDWALSRERYWGTPLPVWRCEAGHTLTIGSFTELEQLSGTTLKDHHRPYVDEVVLPCTHEHDPLSIPSTNGESHEQPGASKGAVCGRPMKRVPEVIDVWFDSGSMPFAQHHYPHENEQQFQKEFPADFICEALDQTRGWFYSLLAVSTLLFDKSSYENVVCLGLILDADGQKMSKSKGNTVEPWQVLDKYGADAFRWYFFTSKQPWDGYRFSEEAIGEGVRLFLKQLWSTYFFYTLYANANADVLAANAGANFDPLPSPQGIESIGAEEAGATGSEAIGSGSSPDSVGDLDHWALSRVAGTAAVVAERLDAYDATTAGRAISLLVDDLSNWYVRRSRRRFWDGDAGAFATLRECLLTVSKLLAPFCPFVADEIYDNLDGTLASVHLCDFPVGDALPARDESLEQAMAIARETVRLGLGARAQAKIKVRQPLAEAVVVADGREREAIERLVEIVREELNVRQVRFVEAADELGEYELKANYRTLGPLFGKDMPLAAKALAALDPARVAAAVRGGPAGGRSGSIGIAVGDREHTLTEQDVILTMKAPKGYSVEREGAHAVALDLTIDDSLLREGRSREIVHAVQNARKSAGLEVEDRIKLILGGDPALLDAARKHEPYVSGETLAVSLVLGDGDAAAMDYREQTEIEDLSLEIRLSRSDRASL
ncbi:MAG TPA: isoleucine--tRNA ligase [Solirubrobacteraceae bacterium]|nr:isoleucine--tRNA ligase [Solirubrobacteraceae bacterium]